MMIEFRNDNSRNGLPDKSAQKTQSKAPQSKVLQLNVCRGLITFVSGINLVSWCNEIEHHQPGTG